jgi:hypothetical protein
MNTIMKTGHWTNRTRTRIGCAVVAAALWATTASAGLYDSWANKAQITFSGYNRTGTLTNFPALVVLGTNISNFATTAMPSKGTRVHRAGSDSITC